MSSNRTTSPCPAQHDCAAHEPAHVHGPGCGHRRIRHEDHFDYLVAGHRHHPHDGHCDDHGPAAAG